ncbi:MAG: hypothetical protein Q4B70_06305 [Lachnospiraceae bacterium]|nr:hypothetical protein [Lachnospiraceae bacterium]
MREKKRIGSIKFLLWIMAAFLILLGTKQDTAAATLSANGKTHSVTATSKGEYHKLKVKKSSYIGINAYGASSSTKNRKLTITCLNSKKKAISPAYQTSIKKSAYFSLKPGTYYIKVRSQAPSYKISATFQKISDKAGASLKKARTLKVGKKTYGIVYNTDSAKKEHWYKFTLKKARKTKISIQKAGGSLGFKITGPAEAEKELTKFKKQKSVTLPAGNYYILLAKPDKKKANEGAIYTITLK